MLQEGGICSYIISVIMVFVIDVLKSDEDNVVKEIFLCFVVQLVYYKIFLNIWVFFQIESLLFKICIKMLVILNIIFIVYLFFIIKKVVIIVFIFKFC